jgi:hypothetical protein
MVEHYIFPHTEAGLATILGLTVSLRRVGFRTRMGETKVGHSNTHVYAMVAVSKKRPNRKERRCDTKRTSL